MSYSGFSEALVCGHAALERGVKSITATGPYRRVHGVGKWNMAYGGIGMVATWNGSHDSANPWNWSHRRRKHITALLCTLNLCYTASSTGFTTTTSPVAHDFNVSATTASLSTSLFSMVTVSSGLLLSVLISGYRRGRVPGRSFGVPCLNVSDDVNRF